jgi:hypothetical protein
MRLTAAVTLIALGVFPGLVLDLARLPGIRVGAHGASHNGASNLDSNPSAR